MVKSSKMKKDNIDNQIYRYLTGSLTNLLGIEQRNYRKQLLIHQSNIEYKMKTSRGVKLVEFQQQIVCQEKCQYMRKSYYVHQRVHFNKSNNTAHHHSCHLSSKPSIGHYKSVLVMENSHQQLSFWKDEPFSNICSNRGIKSFK